MYPQDLNQKQQNSYSYLQNSQGDTGVQAPQENWFQRLLPTIGSIAAPTIGALLAPETGGLSLLAGAALSGAGSAAGKGIENATSGQDLLSGVGTAGAEGLAGGAAGGLAGKALGGAGKFLMQNADGAAARLAGDGMKDVWGQVPARLRQNLNMNSTSQAFKNYGLDFTPDKIKEIAPVVTGSADAGAGQSILHKGTIQALTGAGPVDVSGIQSLAQNIAKSPDMLSNTGAGTAGSKAFLEDVVNRLGAAQLPGDVAKGTVGSLKATDAPTIFEAMQAFEKAAANTSNDALGNAYSSIAKELGNALEKSGANDVAAAGLYSPADLKALAAIHPDLADAAANVTSVAQNRSLQRPFVQASLLANAANKAAEGSFGGPAAKTGGSGLLGTIGGMMGSHPAVSIPLMMANGFAGGEKALGGVLGGVGGSAVPGVLGQVAAHAPSLGVDNNSTGGDQPMSYQTQGQSAQGPGLAWAGAFAPSLVPALQAAQKAQSAQAPLNALESSYGAAGGGQGFGGGLLSQISSMIPGTKAAQYKHQQLQAAAAISQATGIPLPSVLASLPSLMADQNGAQNSFSGLQGALGTMQTAPQFGLNQSVLSGVK